MPIKEISIPRFYADRLTTSKWVHEKRLKKHRCYIYLGARKKFRMVPMDDDQRQAIDEVLRSFGFTEWEAEQRIYANINTQSGYYIYVPSHEFLALDFPPDTN